MSRPFGLPERRRIVVDEPVEDGPRDELPALVSTHELSAECLCASCTTGRVMLLQADRGMHDVGGS